MERELIVEIVNRHAHTRERHRIKSVPFVIGRAYSSDIIIDDPHVCPTHVRVEVDPAQGLMIKDLDSVNGVFDKGKRRVKELHVKSGSSFIIGESEVRIYDGSETPLPTINLRSRARRFTRFISRWPTPIMAVLIVAILHTLVACFLRYNRETSNLFAATLIPTLLGAAALCCSWASVWALLGFTNHHRSFFPAHLSLAGIAGILGIISVQLSEYFAFAFDISPDFCLPVLAAAVAILVLFSHLRFATRQSRRRSLVFAVSIVAILFSLPLIYGFVKRDEFHPEIALNEELKPPPFKLIGSESPEEFFSRGKDIESRLLEDLEKMSSGEKDLIEVRVTPPAAKSEEVDSE